MPRMEPTLYEAEHDAFRSSVRTFCKREIAPFHQEWEKAGLVDRSVWVEAGKQGLLGTDVPEQYGGGGVRDFRYNCVVSEEVTRVGGSGVGFTLHNDVMAPYLIDLTTDEQKERWLPGFVSGELITAIAMSEPGAGSDLQGLKTTARRDGDDWVHQRLQDVHHQRHQQRPRAGRRAHRPGEGRARLLAARGRARHEGLRARPQPRQGRHEGAGHRRAVLRRGARARRATSSARRAGASST